MAVSTLIVNFSVILDKIGVTEMGLRSAGPLILATFGTGVTCACFHDAGTLSLLMDRFIRSAAMSPSSAAHSFKTQYGKPSASVAVF